MMALTHVTAALPDVPLLADAPSDGAAPPKLQLFRREDAEILEAFNQRVHVLLPGAATGGEVCLVEVEVPAGDGPPYHVHRREDETFFIREGRFEFTINGERHETNPGDVVYGPRNVPHTFRNVGKTTGVLQMLAVQAGFESFFRACSQAFAGGCGMDEILKISDKHEVEFLPFSAVSMQSVLTEDMLSPRIIRRGQAEQITYPGGNMGVPLSCAQTGGLFCVLEACARAGDGPPPHIHRRENELFVIYDGELAFGSGRDVVTARSGDVVWAPRGARHIFRCVSSGGANGLIVMLPGEFEGYFRDVAAGFAAGQASPENMMKIFEKYGLEALAPDV